ncbi:MAG: IS200/IS605 family transposase [Planctomycetota bacterium]
MAYSRQLIHIVFATRGREANLNEAAQPGLFGFLASLARDLGCFVHAVGGWFDHVHLLIDLPTRLATADVVRELKARSSRWFKAEFRIGFAWQESYGAFSVSESSRDRVVAYIEGQAEHHRVHGSSKAEWELLLRRHGIEYDPARLE